MCIPTTTEITDFNRGNFFLIFGDIEPMDPPSIFKGSLIVKDFKNPIDQLRVRQALEDENVNVLLFPPELDEFKSTKTALTFSRNLFKALNHIQVSSPAPKEKTEADELIGNKISTLETNKLHSRKRENSRRYPCI